MKKIKTYPYKVNQLEIKRGSRKLPPNTLIFNMGSGQACPSRALGFCKVCSDCYAVADEITYPDAKPYRDRQENYWKTTSLDQIKADFRELLECKKTRLQGKLQPIYNAVKYFRFNESGDFWNNDCKVKLNELAKMLKSDYNIITYGYTARCDMEFENMSFRVKSSGYKNGNHGDSRVIDDISELKPGEKLCKGDCYICGYCRSEKPLNIAFLRRKK